MIFLNEEDIAAGGFTDGQLVDIDTHWPDDEVVRCVRASNTPTSKSVIVRLMPAGQGHQHRVADASQDATGSDWSHQWEPDVEEHLS